MKNFRFAILGAGHIARRFCDAVSRIDGCEVCAVASKSLVRAENFAKENGVESYYDDYETLLEKEKPDCAYIAVTTNDHYRLSVLCVITTCLFCVRKRCFKIQRKRRICMR